MTMRIHDTTPSPSNRRKTLATPDPAAPLRERVVYAIRQVFDPEIPVNIYDLGLIYDIQLDEPAKSAKVIMTLTTPHCPEAQSIPEYVKQMVERVEGIDAATVEIIWDPPWKKEMMSDEAKLILGMT